MDNLMQLSLKTYLFISSAISNCHVKARGFCHKACHLDKTKKVLLEGQLPLSVITVTVKLSIRTFRWSWILLRLVHFCADLSPCAQYCCA